MLKFFLTNSNTILYYGMHKIGKGDTKPPTDRQRKGDKKTMLKTLKNILANLRTKKAPADVVRNSRGNWSIVVDGQPIGNYATYADAARVAKWN